jgi:hypothetical protein
MLARRRVAILCYQVRRHHAGQTVVNPPQRPPWHATSSAHCSSKMHGSQRARPEQVNPPAAAGVHFPEQHVITQALNPTSGRAVPFILQQVHAPGRRMASVGHASRHSPWHGSFPLPQSHTPVGLHVPAEQVPHDPSHPSGPQTLLPQLGMQPEGESGATGAVGRGFFFFLPFLRFFLATVWSPLRGRLTRSPLARPASTLRREPAALPATRDRARRSKRASSMGGVLPDRVPRRRPDARAARSRHCRRGDSSSPAYTRWEACTGGTCRDPSGAGCSPVRRIRGARGRHPSPTMLPPGLRRGFGACPANPSGGIRRWRRGHPRVSRTQ